MASSDGAEPTGPGQYAIDLVADAAACEVLGRAPVAVLSEESGWSGPAGAELTVVLDPVDGSTNASRPIPYWATSLCVLDGDGPLVALVVNQATGVATTAVRGEGARRGRRADRPGEGRAGRGRRGGPVRAARASGSPGSSSGRWDRPPSACATWPPGRWTGWSTEAPGTPPGTTWAGLLICREAGAEVVDAAGRELVVADPDARRQLLAAGHPGAARGAAPGAALPGRAGRPATA